MYNNKIKRNLIHIMIMLLAVLCFAPGWSYVVDGFVDDWGIDLSAAINKGYLDSHLPSEGLDVDYKTEDNAAANIYGWQNVSPGYSYGDNNPLSLYYKKGNTFDAEAMYFDNDENYGYIAIIQGMPITGGSGPGNPWLMPGAVAIDADNNPDTGEYGYEYGLDIMNSHLYQVSDWGSVLYSQHASANPWSIASGIDLGEVDFVYSGNQNSHYVLELGIPLDMLGLNPGDEFKIHWTQECGNDYLDLCADVNIVPEPSTFMLMLVGIAGLLGRSRKKRI